MGKGNSASTESEKMMGQAFKDMSSLNTQLQKEASPWRQAAGASYMDALNNPAKWASPGLNELSRGTAQGLNAAEQMEPGGARDRAQRDLRMNQRTQSAQMLNAGKGQAAAALGNLGSGTAQTGISAMGQANTAAGNMGQLGVGQSQAKASGAAGFGSLLGGL